MQAIGGLAEAGAGISAIVGSGFLMTAVGAPVAAHGMDNYFTGMRKLFSGTPQDTLTSQLLQKTGLSSNIAGMVDSGTSMVGIFGAIAAIRSAGQAAFRIPAGWKPEGPILFGQETVSPYFSMHKGSFKYKGLSISEVSQGLKNGNIHPNELPIEIIIRNEQRISLNNRSLLAFKRSGVNPSIIIDRTGLEAYENLLDRHLKGGLPSEFIQIRGGPIGTSLLYPQK